MRSSIVIDMEKKSRRYIHPIYSKYVKEFGKRPKNLDKAYMKLAGHEELEIPALDLAFERLAKRHRYKNSQLDKAYKYLAGRVKA